MKKLLSIRYSNGMFNFTMLMLRVVFGCMMLINHGMPKLMDFAARQNQFYNFMGMGAKFSLILTIFAEVFCSLFIIIGLFTRITVIPLIVMLLVILFGVDAGKSLLESELALLYLTVFSGILFLGPGRISVDGLISK